MWLGGEDEATFQEQQKGRDSLEQLHTLFLNSYLKNSYVVMGLSWKSTLTMDQRLKRLSKNSHNAFGSSFNLWTIVNDDF